MEAKTSLEKKKESNKRARTVAGLINSIETWRAPAFSCADHSRSRRSRSSTRSCSWTSMQKDLAFSTDFPVNT